MQVIVLYLSVNETILFYERCQKIGKSYITWQICFSVTGNTYTSIEHPGGTKSTRFEPSHEIIALFVLCKLIIQMRMRSHPEGLDAWCLVTPFV